MNWSLIIFAFGFGTFKFVFVHWGAYAAFGDQSVSSLFQIFISATLGAWITMAVFYYLSEYFMERAHRKKIDKMRKALEAGIEIKQKKNFTRINKAIVWIKNTLGLYGVTILAPLFLSIPIGAIVCAKFYGRKKKTFILMLLFTGLYSAIMCLSIYFIKF
ncbi:MAG: hypothetical protein ACPG21_06225 [Crocinitomicaceae bacterium]